MKKFIEWLKKICAKLHIPYDKVLHFGVNFIMALTAVFSYTFAVGLCIGASFGKEYGDSKASGNSWSWADIVADMLGMAAGLVVAYLIRLTIGR